MRSKAVAVTTDLVRTPEPSRTRKAVFYSSGQSGRVLGQSGLGLELGHFEQVGPGTLLENDRTCLLALKRVPVRRFLHVAAVLSVVACAAMTGVSAWSVAGRLLTFDRNGDGRPDVWRWYDAHGECAQVAVDTNFDGRPDVQEYYRGGKLVRRELDRNFDSRIDLVEEFTGATEEHFRTVVDTDHDGTADLLVLFEQGKPVLTKRLAATTQGIPTVLPSSVTEPSNQVALIPLADPFRVDTAMRALELPRATMSIALAASGMPYERANFARPSSSERIDAPLTKALIGNRALTPEPRGPPLA
jgi:hypothetical protein